MKYILLLAAGLLAHLFVSGQTTWQKVRCGTEFSLALKSDSSLWGWGNNSSGQLGTGNTTTEYLPVQVGADYDWVDMVAGAFHTLAIKSDGSLWAWGLNGNDQLGTGGDESQLTEPTQVGEDYDWKNVYAGQAHSVAIKDDGTMWAWGFNFYGQLGIGNTEDQNTPVQIDSPNQWLSASCGGGHTLAIAADSTLWAFGINATGQLGEDVDTQSTIPVQVGLDSDWVEVSAGFEFSLGRKSDGSIWSWGFNGNGQLGNGTEAIGETPGQIGVGESWNRIVAAASYAFAIRSDGVLFGWGFNGQGQLGTGGTASENEPFQIGVESDWLEIAGATGGADGVQVFGTHSLGIREPRTVICATGSNYIGQTGNQGGVQILGFDCSTGDLSVGVFEQELSDREPFTVFPNPAVDQVTVVLKGDNGEAANYRILSTDGQMLISGSENSNVFQINLGNLNSGLYIIAIEQSGRTQHQRVVID